MNQTEISTNNRSITKNFADSDFSRCHWRFSLTLFHFPRICFSIIIIYWHLHEFQLIITNFGLLQKFYTSSDMNLISKNAYQVLVHCIIIFSTIKFRCRQKLVLYTKLLQRNGIHFVKASLWRWTHKGLLCLAEGNLTCMSSMNRNHQCLQAPDLQCLLSTETSPVSESLDLPVTAVDVAKKTVQAKVPVTYYNITSWRLSLSY